MLLPRDTLLRTLQRHILTLSVHISVHSTAIKLRLNMQIQKAIEDNMPQINSIHFMPRRDPVPLMWACIHTHIPKTT